MNEYHSSKHRSKQDEVNCDDETLVAGVAQCRAETCSSNDRNRPRQMSFLTRIHKISMSIFVPSFIRRRSGSTVLSESTNSKEDQRNRSKSSQARDNKRSKCSSRNPSSMPTDGTLNVDSTLETTALQVHPVPPTAEQIQTWLQLKKDGLPTFIVFVSFADKYDDDEISLYDEIDEENYIDYNYDIDYEYDIDEDYDILLSLPKRRNRL
jgi:hypothetical protein